MSHIIQAPGGQRWRRDAKIPSGCVVDPPRQNLPPLVGGKCPARRNGTAMVGQRKVAQLGERYLPRAPALYYVALGEISRTNAWSSRHQIARCEHTAPAGAAGLYASDPRRQRGAVQ